MTSAPISVCLAGATGWAGSELARAIASTSDIVLVAAVSRTHAGRRLGEVLGDERITCPISPSAAEALATRCDVFVEYTKPDSAKANVLAAVEHGSHVVVGTSGLTEQDYAEIDIAARRQARGVLGVGNFALTVVLMQKFAETAAKLIPQWEVIDYAHDDKIDAPSGTARELAARLSRARRPELTVSVEQTTGEPAARGATLAGAQVHSVRLPGFVISAEVIFGMPDQRLSIRHDSGSSARPYVDGALLASPLSQECREYAGESSTHYRHLEEQPATIAALLTAADNGDDTAKDRLFAVLYAELHAMARREAALTPHPQTAGLLQRASSP